LAHAEPETDGKDGRCGRQAGFVGACLGADDLPPEYWQALLDDPRTDAKVSGSSIGKLRLSQIAQHLLRVTCRRCGRIVEIQKSDAARLHGAEAIWKDVGQRLLDNTCTQRTGRHEEDGCWLSYDMS